MQASEYSRETYFFVMVTLDKCESMMKPIWAAEYHTLVRLVETNQLIQRYEDGTLFDDGEEMQNYTLESYSSIEDEEEVPTTQEIMWPSPADEELPSDFDAEAFWDLSDLPDPWMEFDRDE